MGKLETQDLIAKLISFDTTSALSNLDLINFIADYLDEFGISSIRVFSKDKTKANLIATIGPERDGGVVLQGTPMSCLLRGRLGKQTPFNFPNLTGSCMAEVRLI
jgi:acetylornithine deacetylase